MHRLTSNLKVLLILALANLALVTLIYLPFLTSSNNFYALNFSVGINSIYRNYDGLNYIVIAKSLYNPLLIQAIPQTLPAGYYAAHFPGYSLFILAFSPLLGFLKSMLFTSILFTFLANIAFFYLVKNFKLSNHPLILSLIFLVLPARWLIVHSVGSAEPMFIFFTITSIYAFLSFQQTQKFYLILTCALLASAAQLTRPPGILLFIAYAIFILVQIIKSKNILKNLGLSLIRYSPLILIPLTLVGIFYYYSFVYQDFLAYFHSGDNIHLQILPFAVFNLDQYWVGEIWLEDIVFTLLLGFYAALLLIKNGQLLFGIYTLTYLTATIFVAHRDISRYALPIFPFVLIAYEKALTSKEFRIVLAILLLGIYLYAENFLIHNTAPIANLAIYN